MPAKYFLPLFPHAIHHLFRALYAMQSAATPRKNSPYRHNNRAAEQANAAYDEDVRGVCDEWRKNSKTDV